MTGFLHNRWAQLLAGIVCMVMVSSLQQAGRSLSSPSTPSIQWGRAAIQAAFAILILAETWLVPFEGWFVDQFGPRPVAVLGGVPGRRFAGC